jgi:hypothetical protein
MPSCFVFSLNIVISMVVAGELPSGITLRLRAG